MVGLTHYVTTSNFGRGDYPDYPTYRYVYDDYKMDYPREELEFFSSDNKLKAFLYGGNATDKLLIFVHGLDLDRLNKVNKELFDEITGFFDKASK